MTAPKARRKKLANRLEKAQTLTRQPPKETA
jgi:hypothetical protein